MRKIVMLLCLIVFSIESSFSLILLQTQQEVDEFSVNYPDMTNVEGLGLYGEGIVSLNGLSHVENIERFYVHYTSVETLDGLENLKSVGDFELFNNIKLYDIDAINDLSISSDNPSVTIVGSPLLNDCSLSFICDLLAQYKDITIGGNGGECKNSKEARIHCGLQDGISQDNVIFEDGFEYWENEMPVNWTIASPTYIPQFKIYSYDQEPALSEGDYAIRLRGDTLSYDFSSGFESVNLSFDFMIRDLGYANVLVDQVNNLTGEHTESMLFNLYLLKRDTIHSLFLTNITPFTEDHTIASIKFVAKDVFVVNPDGQPYQVYPSLLIDNVVLSYNEPLAVSNLLKDKYKLLPNPFSDFVNVQHDTKDSFTVNVFDSQGRLLMREESPNSLSTGFLAPGYYIVQIVENNQTMAIPMVKN